jgi:murein DD-endopeptidase MepM/ murein hydrolase activator NlpD
MIAAIGQQKVLRRRSSAHSASRPPGGLSAGGPARRSSGREGGVARRAGRAQMRLRARPLRVRPLFRPLRWLAGISRPHLALGAAVLAAALVPLALRTSAPVALSLPAGDENVLLAYLVPGDAPPARRGPPLIGSLRLSSYTVQSGDTLSGIAQRFGLAMDTLISFNGIQDARALKVGLRLSLPNANGLKYRVRRGDSLEGIARRFGVQLNDLLDWNSLESSLIVPGQELFVPGARLSEHDLDRVFGRLFIFPSRGRLSSRFGVRGDPFTGISRFHNGIDLAGPVGTPVLAAMSGRVSMVGYNPNYGRYVILSHAEGFQTLYGHLDSFQVRKAARVKQGELIGTMGNSGYSTGSHLHFSIFLRGEPVDPSRYLH